MRALQIIFALVISAAVQPAAWSQTLAGKWLGQSSAQEEIRCWVSHRRSDGTYQLTFLLKSPKGDARHIEEGLWLHSNGLYATITLRINGEDLKTRDSQYREFYRVESLDSKQFLYREITSGARFRVVKVPDDFLLTDKCPFGK